MDTSQWPQGYIGVVRAVENTSYKKSNVIRPQKDLSQAALNCPRCNSNNTKFCYYNNYSLSQPRYLCKTCKRYWTAGGNLRNVPVGGASRRNKRRPSEKNVTPNLSPPAPKISPDRRNPKFHDERGKTLNLDFGPSSVVYSAVSDHEFGGNLPFGLDSKNNLISVPQNPSFCSSSFSNSSQLPFSSLISMPVLNYNSNYVHDFKPGLSFSLDHHGFGNGYGDNLEGVQVLKPDSTSDDQLDEQGKGQLGDHSNGYWNYGVMNGGSW